MDKIYIVETAEYTNGYGWVYDTSKTYFATEERAIAYCKEQMARDKADWPDGWITEEDGVYQFHADGDEWAEEYQCYPVELH